MRLLFVEDDRRIVAALSRHLKAEGYAFDVAPDGETGEELAHVTTYDVIILDIMLPKQDGWTTCANLRNSGILTPILMLTALDDYPNRIKGLDRGADDYLVKPFHIGELLARLRALVRRKTEIRSAMVERFDVQLDLNTHRAYRNGVEIRLTAKEFALLELFMMNPNKILSREMISENLWDMNFEPRSNVIESFIKILRQKLDRNFPKQLIHTARGAGYMFSEREP